MLSQVASRSGRAPSELVGITCDWCAYCFDEALLLREAAMRAEPEERAPEAPDAAQIAQVRARMGLAS